MAITDFPTLFATLDDAARSSDFGGVVSIDVDGDLVGARAYGFADRAYGVVNTVDTRFGVASIAKGFTAVAVRAPDPRRRARRRHHGARHPPR